MLTGLRVLVVDNDELDTLLVSHIVEAYGGEARTCSSAVEALRIVALWRPDVIVSDIDMPERDGYWLIRSLRLFEAKAGGNTPAVAVSAHCGPECRIMTDGDGFQKHLTKPFRTDELVEAIAELAQRNLVNCV